MEWTKERVRELRLRMGWSLSDLARHLEVELSTVYQIENGNAENFDSIKSELTLFWNQAESLSEDVLLSALAEQVLEETRQNQLFKSDLQDKYIK